MQMTGRRFRSWKPLELFLVLVVAVWLLWGGFALNTQTQLAERVVRLHVLANSDTEDDQQLKLQVRDAVTAETTRLLDGVSTRREAEQILERSIPDLRRAAQERVMTAGYAYPVEVELAMTQFPTKEYDGFSLPAGEYLALRVLIGEAVGQNWWCVVFPPLCSAAVSDVAVTALAAGLDAGQVKLITEEDGYILKFKTVEWWQKLRETIEK